MGPLPRGSSGSAFPGLSLRVCGGLGVGSELGAWGGPRTWDVVGFGFLRKISQHPNGPGIHRI